MSDTVGIVGWGTAFPKRVETAADLVGRTGIPEKVLREKMGIHQRHVAGSDDTVTAMASAAARKAIHLAGIDPAQINIVISHGSEYKDHNVWNAAAKIASNVGAVNAYAFDLYALCAGAPIAINAAKGLMLAGPHQDYALLAAGSRENDLVNPANQRARFMFNFGAGGGAMLLQYGAARNLILGASALTDGSLSEAVILTHAPGALEDGAAEALGDLRGRLDVTDSAFMAERLGVVSLPNFVRVIREAVERSGAAMEDVRFLGITHMKRSFFEEILETIGLTPDRSAYIDNYGHIQSVDQVLSLEIGLAQEKIRPGDLIVLAAAGTGYTWSAVAVRWG